MSETELPDPIQDEDVPGEATVAPETPSEQEDDPEAEEDEETPEEPSQEDSASPQTQKEIEAAVRKLEKHQETNYNRIVAILGDAADDLAPCALCNHPALGDGRTPGWRAEVIPNDVVVQRVRQAIGLADYSDYAKATHARECDDCRGRGNVLSGSKVPGKEAVQCPRCKGNGFVHIGGTPTPVEPVSAPTNGDVVFTADTTPPSETDPWGRLPTDPLFGVMPNLVAQRQAVQ